METDTIIRYFKVQRRDLAYLKFIVESYEGLATLSTADREGGVVVVSYSSCFAKDMGALMESLGTEIALEEVSNAGADTHA